jgi:hypothetical protein
MVATPRARRQRWPASRTTSRSGSPPGGVHAGRQRSARSHSRCGPARPATMIRPWVQSTSSMRSTLRPAVQPDATSTALGPVLQHPARQGPVGPDAAQDRAPQGLVLGQPGPYPPVVGPAVRRVAAHQQLVDRIVAGADDHGRVRPVLEQAPLPPQQPLQVGRVELAKAAPQHQLVAAGDHADRVQLQAAEVAGHLHDPVGAGRRARAAQVLAGDEQPAGQRRVDGARCWWHLPVRRADRAPRRCRRQGRWSRCGRWRRRAGAGRGCGQGPRRRRCHPRSRAPAACRSGC